MSEAPHDLVAGLSGRYTLERELGRGGMATVWLAHDLKHDRPVALKVLHQDLATTLGPERFLREIKLAARLQHPNIVPVYDSGEVRAAGAPPRLWFTMPYIEGESLRDRLRRGRLPTSEAIKIARQVSQALQFAHEHHVLHRDIKPENILLTKDGSTLVADFGIARPAGPDATPDVGLSLTGLGIVLGTPAYMSPEQATARTDLDGRTDQYSLGCVLYEMLAGAPPFSATTAQGMVAAHIAKEPPKLTGDPGAPSQGRGQDAGQVPGAALRERDGADRRARHGGRLARRRASQPSAGGRGRPRRRRGPGLRDAFARGR